MEDEMLDLFPDEDPNGTPTETEDEDGDLDLSEAFAAAEKDEAEEDKDKGEEDGTGTGGETSPARAANALPDSAGSFTLNHLGHLQTVGRKDVVALAQKGLDYDFIKAKLEEARGKLKTYETPASPKPEAPAAPAANGVPERPSAHSASLLPEGRIPGSSAREAGRGYLGRADINTSGGREGEERRKGEVRQIMKYHPDFSGGKIPDEVWEEVRLGASLPSAFLMHENRKLRSELDTARQERLNREKTPGSVSSAGSRRENLDPFLAALSED
ncbi:hypothetical protein [Papillibacter cinnamivorans]|uniref:Uncharacterized protein n=1 Tax=Papillibacter cinnamivorans DSM 12816 TaxID=1122930 RepID=A0A1W2C5R6_9FIRM|nr:hypothetical protein [Papillibacter cinnamivorans]SMC80503.1 hypothetical protein SAMN02745168_2578 [Papillibacter cinnamivorans DSM 12816]